MSSAPARTPTTSTGDGAGALGWQAGKSVAEFCVPLNSGDPEDVALKPGDRVLFNLVYADAFAAGLKGTEFGGLSTASADDASGWGYLVLAANVSKEEPAPVPEWLAKLFPYTGAPDECAHRLRRVEAAEVPVGADYGGVVTCEFIHRNVAGKTEHAQACLYLPPELRRDPAARVPLMANAGYELEAGGAAALLAKGWAVSTPHAHPLNPLDRGPNLDLALLHAARSLPFIDNSRVMIQGGSAGGYTTLMLAAESFPLLCAVPLVPPVNWGYNAAYLFHNRELATAVPPGAQHAAMPVVQVVIPLADAGIKSNGPDPQADSWLLSSPISHLETITAPTLAVWSTGDMLVPIDQVGAEFVRGEKPGLFPAGFTAAIDTLMTRPEGRATLLSLLPEASREVFLVPVPPGAPVLPHEGAPAGTPPPLKLPFSEDRVWSLVVVDEGPREPDAGHFRYAFAPDSQPFIQWASSRGLTAGQLTLPKLTRLMMRLQGREYRPFKTVLDSRQPIPGVRLDYPAAERQDVLGGLLAFSENPACAARLAEYYAQLPQDRKALGASLGRTPEEIAATLRKALAGK